MLYQRIMSIGRMQTDSTTAIKIADITVALSSIDPRLKIELDGDVRRFYVPSATPDLEIRASWGDCSNEEHSDPIFDSGGTWKLFRKDDTYCFHCFSPVFGWIPYKVARLAHDFRFGEVFFHGPFFDTSHPVYPLQYPLDELLVLNLLSNGRGIEVHACGIVDLTGAGCLFAGQSGAGKSTMARLWQKEGAVKLLSDDRVILRKEGGQFWMYGTPWHGEAGLASPDRAPLKQLFFLRHANANELIARSGAQAAAQIFSCAFPIFYSADALAFTLQLCDEIANSIPCYELRAVPNRSVVEFIRNKSRL
jgi:hypothetical protein